MSWKRGRSRPKCVGSQEINLFVQVALNPYGSSSACRLTWYSTRDLIWNSNLGVGFPLRCFQRLSVRNIATRRYCWRNNRHTRDSSREVLSSINLQLLGGLDYTFTPTLYRGLALLWKYFPSLRSLLGLDQSLRGRQRRLPSVSTYKWLDHHIFI